MVSGCSLTLYFVKKSSLGECCVKAYIYIYIYIFVHKFVFNHKRRPYCNVTVDVQNNYLFTEATGGQCEI